LKGIEEKKDTTFTRRGKAILHLTFKNFLDQRGERDNHWRPTIENWKKI